MRDGFSAKAQKAFERQWVLFIRQSTIHQRLVNVGSGDVQAQQLRTMERMNVRPDQIVTIDARGESGRAEVVRKHFEELIHLLKTGLVGVLVLARFDRIGRNDEDTGRVLRLLAKQGGMLLIDGRIYDPKEPTDKLSLGVQSAFAEYDNLARARWMMLARLAMARQLKARIALPTGLVWANPRNEVFRTRLVSAGLGGWLERLGEHRAIIGREPVQQLVFPHPDREIYDSARLRLDWMLESQNLSELRARIREPGSGWPRPGKVPVVRTSIYSPDHVPLWIPVEHSELADWYLSPALYSIYAYAAQSLADADDLPIAEFSVWEPGAFPSYAEPEDLERIQSFLSRAPSKPWKSSLKSPEHVLPNVRCGRVRENGTPCGRQMSSTGSGGERRYSTCCRHAAPSGSVSHVIEDPVLEVLVAALRPEEIKTAVGTLRLDRDAALERRNAAQLQRDDLKAGAEAALELTIEAQARKHPELVSHYMRRHSELTTQAAEAERKLAVLCMEENQIRAVTKQDYTRVLALATDLPRLVQDARSNPSVLQKLVGELTRAVHILPLAHGVVAVDIEFPTGVRVRRVVETHPTRSSQPQRLYAASRLEAGAKPADVADELNRALATIYQRAPSTRPFNARRVKTMAAMHIHGGDVPPREGHALDRNAIAARYGVSPAEALEAILQGELGPASWTSEGELGVVPTSDEAAWVFVEWARREVAAQKGWSVDDTVTVVEAVEALGLSRENVLANAERCSGPVRMPARRVWVRRSEAADPEAVVRARLHELRPDLDPTWWVALKQAPQRAGRSRETLKKHFPVARPGFGAGGVKSVYVWLSPDLPLPWQAPSLAEAVQALGGEYDPNDFVPLTKLAADLRSRVNFRNEEALRSAAREGRIVSVRVARTGRGLPTALYVLVPPDVRTAESAEVVRAWLGHRSRG
jgi:DNA invertase Pin-like site-specific DNA recombinase